MPDDQPAARIASAARWGIEPEYLDAMGERRRATPETVDRLVEALARAGTPPPAFAAHEPKPAFQGEPAMPEKVWLLAVQLYAVRSRRNWGHGDFTDLTNLIEIAASLGAAGIGLNPLHALFADRPDEPSPYAPSSRLWLNPFYLDLEAVPEFPGLAAAGIGAGDLRRLRSSELVDYPGVAALKRRGLDALFAAFCRSASPARQEEFGAFRRERGQTLSRYAAFEALRARFGGPFWEWPEPWRAPDDGALARLSGEDGDGTARTAFEQWLCHVQLEACSQRARTLGLHVGLYLDVAVGVRADGFDAWNEPAAMLQGISVGAPPDPLNTGGQNWGLTGFSPSGLAADGMRPFRRMLEAAMRYAGAIRLDHVLGLKRLYLIPAGRRATDGAYVGMPLDALLAAVSDESRRNHCIVIGEDLGTVPPGFRETLAAWGIWTYQVMMFARTRDGGFASPRRYPRNALATFGTHDLPTFAGWMEGHDLAVKQALGIDPGESSHERERARRGIGEAVRGTPDFAAVARLLAGSRSRLLSVAIEDMLGVRDQVNVPGTVNEHPNWRRKLPADLEDLAELDAVRATAAALATRASANSFR